MKKACSLILSVLLLLCALPTVGISAEDVAAESTFQSTDFTVDEAHNSTTAVSGDAESGYTFTLSGSGRTHIMTVQSYPLATLSFDFGYKYSGSLFGEFGVSLTGDVEAIGDYSDENTLVFFYRVAGAQCHIYLRHKDGEKEIAVFTESDRKGDPYWSSNVSNFSFVRDGEHWFLALDGHLCNNVEENTEYSYLDSVLGNSIFDNNDSVYLHVGGYDSGTVYFKQLSVTSEDGAWETRAVDSFQYEYNGLREYRGQGYTAGTVHSAVPATAVGSKTDGHVINFTGTDGYAQSTEGFDLKNTAFQFAPITYDGNTANLWYYLGFTANPSVIQYHSSKPSDTIEFRAASVYGNNYTGGWVVTNSSGCLATPTNISLGKIFTWKTHRYEDTYSNTYMTVSFVQDTGADGALHWYMKTVCSGATIIVKSTDTETDKYLQFDSIIDKPVYFRLGTDGKNTDSSFKMYCKVVDTSEDGSGGWATESQALPTVSAVQEGYIKTVKTALADLTNVTEANITEALTQVKEMLAAYDKLNENALQYLSDAETARVAELRVLYEEYAVYAYFDIDEAHKATTSISGDAVNGYTYTLNGSGRTRIITKEAYPISTLSFDYGYKYNGNLFGEFGVSKLADVSNMDDGYSDDNTLTFFYRVTGSQLIVSVRWENLQEKQIGVFDFATYRKGDGYYSNNVSNFSFVKVGEHWHLAADGNICNNVEDNFDYSCLEYMLGEETFENNENVYLYFGGYNTGTGYFKQLSVTSTDGAWETRAVDSYRYTFSGAVREYRGQGNTDETVHSAIPAAAVGSEADGHVIDFTGTDGYAQTTDAYDLKTTTFYMSPITYDGNTANLWYYLGFTANPSVIQYHSSKPSDTIEFRAASVNGDNYTGGWVVTNSNGCLASPTNISLGKLFSWKTHRYEDTYSNAYMTISFVQEEGADGELHWYMKTVCSGAAITVKSTDTDTDKYLQFDSIIDKPVYFRLGTDGKNTDTSFKMYAKIVGTKVVTVSPLYCEISSEDFIVNYNDGAEIDGVAYNNGDVLDRVGEYAIKYTQDTTIYNRRLILYKTGDVNTDNVVDIRDLVRFKKKEAGLSTFDTVAVKAADTNIDNEITSADLAELRKILLK